MKNNGELYANSKKLFVDETETRKEKKCRWG
jgi:hypothetical protein